MLNASKPVYNRFFHFIYTNTVKIPSKKIEVLFKLENFIKKNNPE
jgi:hypothetical protein